jgi:hypothetical protein
MIPSGYDPITLNHWLWFKYQCHECSPMEFQRLFENVIKRARPEFMQIRPYGNIGDRKCDGLFHADGTVFQVYAPYELKQAELQAKIEEDCDGALANWHDLKNWVFVYNARRGLPPDISATLSAQQAKHPTLTIKSLSSDALWEMARNLTVQQRAEILGAPNGYEHLFLGPQASESEVQIAPDQGGMVLVQDLMSPVNLRDIATAMRPARHFGAPLWVRPSVDALPWDLAAAEQTDILNEVLQCSRELSPGFSVFSFAQIPLALHLGFVLSDRVEVECYQFDRQRNTWRWPDDPSDADFDIQVKGAPGRKVTKTGDAVIRVSLSAKVSPEDTRKVTRGAIEIDISVKSPDVFWLRTARQLRVVADRFRQALTVIRNFMPGCQRIHLFYAGPTGGAVKIGQQINPRMNPPVETYQYSRQTDPCYQRALSLQEPQAMESGSAPTPSSVLPKRRTPSGLAKHQTKPAVMIQFIAGDRGGGPRSLIQAPRENNCIQDAIAGGTYRDSFGFANAVFAASIDNLVACQKHQPTIVHFVGHGEEREMILMRDRDMLVETLSLEPGHVETLFASFSPKVRLVFFNTCRSLELARHLTAKGIVDLAMGVAAEIPDDHAIRFANTFYRALSDGRSVQTAFELACLQLNGLEANSRPQLLVADGLKPDIIVFAAQT